MAVAQKKTDIPAAVPETMQAMASPPPAPQPKPVPVAAPALNPNLFKREEFLSTTYRALIPSDHKYEAILVPEYWCHVAQKSIRIGTEIKAVHEKFWCLLLVTANGDTWAKVVPLLKVDLTAADHALPVRASYKIDKSQEGWRVIHRDSSKAVVDKLPTQDAAENYLDTVIVRAGLR